MTTFATPIDNAATTLADPRAPGAGSVALAAGTGPRFGSPSPSAPIRVTLVAASALDANGFLVDRTKLATYLATGRSGDTLTGLTLESGTDQGFGTGDPVAVLIDARTLADVHDAIGRLEALPPGDLHFTFTQSTPAATWTVAHNLGKYPSVSVVTSAGDEVEGDVRHLSANALTVSFAAGFSGTAYLN